MDIRLDSCDGWYVNEEYRINGNNEDGYSVYKAYDENENSLFNSADFEECLTWCWNS